VVIQFLDGYVIKPRLFGNSLGVSGLLIIAAVVISGNMFGVLGILLSIPFAAILDSVYKKELLPALEKKRAEKDAKAEAAKTAEAADEPEVTTETQSENN
ncbi:MAG: AI-2E family transporter, partial [Oscillospiraceae bacterium]|nr:AI-2E family transporter [Oscillospiraceae bacterium]